ncbi:sigma-70 family RNA polymerase sigma factor [Sphingomonas sp. PB4P5]|uniref:sigma-70 family RNA polymerase sigma factor n=1 Tax=Parasphingomonas puruogangriensis TaxID=3096155 RepID=UPI002FCB1A90
MPVATPERALWLTQHILVHEPELRSWLNRRSVPGLDVDDIVQESYAILAGLEAVDHIYRPRIYFFEVAKSVILRSFRQSRVIAFSALADFDALLIPDDTPSPEMVAAGRQELGLLARLIDELPPKCREAFVLRKVRGLSQREVAIAMGVSENTIEKHIGKALGLLGSIIGHGGSHRKSASNRYEPPAVEQTEWATRDSR